MSNEEKLTNTQQDEVLNDAPETVESDESISREVNEFLDSISDGGFDGESPDDFLNKLYGESFDNLTADFDSLLESLTNIDPDEEIQPELVDTEVKEESEASVKAVDNAEEEVEDIFSYSDNSVEDEPRKLFSEAVKEAIDAEEGIRPQEIQQEGNFTLSLDKIDDSGDNGLGEAIKTASATQTQKKPKSAQKPAVQQKKPAANAQKKPAKKKVKKSRFLPTKDDSVFEIFRKVLFLVSTAVIIVCLGIIGNIYLIQPYIETQRNSKIDELLDNPIDQNSLGDTQLPEGASYNLAQFYAANNDFYGYLSIPGTNMAMPVVQGKDNDKYLTRNFFGEKTKYGCPFVNYKNTYASLDYNTSIFGHNMEYDDLVFGELENYRTIDGFKKAPIIKLETMYAEHTFKIYAVFLADGAYDPSGYYFHYIFTQLKDEAECAEYIEQLDQRKFYSTGVDILPTDKLLTLSTCCYDFGTARLVVVGRLVREGESTDVDVTRATANSNPRYPDKYYSVKGIANPYKDAEKWVPNQ
ncbi:MAG: class B sortase [Clostridia bacterium]|nr:class B sortase [Clostridia bacterium]